jgi:two-component system NarL family sensor kinase
MKEPDEIRIITAIILATFFLIVLFGFIIFFLFLYQRRRTKHLIEITRLKLSFVQTILQTELEIQEHAFNHISQEIHDNVGQVLSLAKMQANIIATSESKAKDLELFKELKENINKALADLREMAKSLSTERVKEMNLFVAITLESERINKSGNIGISCLLQGQEHEMDGQKKLILFRIIQESLQNIIRHASASKIEISLIYDLDKLKASIKDNGKGFNVEEKLKLKTGLGLRNIITRASMAGGNSDIKSIINEGTTITIKMPYKKTN